MARPTATQTAPTSSTLVDSPMGGPLVPFTPPTGNTPNDDDERARRAEAARADAAPRTAPRAAAAVPHAPAAISTPRGPRFLERWGSALLVVGSVATGAVLQAVMDRSPLVAPAPAPRAPAVVTPTRIAGPVTLRGPSGNVVTLPMSTPAVVNVWLQGCGDCMPAFEAWKSLQASGGLDSPYPVVNVAYGRVDPAWALEHGTDANLVVDPSGSALVRPLGIGTFTTMIVDPQGFIRLKERPDAQGFGDRVAGALRALQSEPKEPAR